MAVSLAVPANAAMTTEQRLRALENLVREQQQEIKALRGELKQQKAVGNATQQQAERAEESAKATDKKVVASIPIGPSVWDVEFGAGSVWATSELDGTVSRIDPATN